MISTLSILVIVSLLGIYYLSSVRLHKLKNTLFLNDVKARLLARGGMHMAIANLKYGVDGARDNFCDMRTEDWFYDAGAGVALDQATLAQTSFPGLAPVKENIDLGSNLIGNIYLKILDGASQINLNDNNPNLTTILANLPGMNIGLANAIIGYRNALPGAVFSYETQIMSVAGMTDAIYEQIRDYVTIYSWSDEKATTGYNAGSYSTTVSGAQSRSPINVNTAPQEVLEAVLSPVVPAQAAAVAAAIVTHVTTTPLTSWQEFSTYIDGLALPPSIANDIKNNANPNRIKPVGYTTEFSFHSGGYYEIEVLARIQRINGSTVARKGLTSFVKIFDVVQHTLQNDFRDEDTNNDGDYVDASYGEGNFDTTLESGARLDNTNYDRVTWLDSCPVDESDDQNHLGYNGSDPNEISPFLYRTIPNAMKLGFWDNFDEGQGTNQSRAWWGNEFSYNIEISDVGTNYNYNYQAGDFSESSLGGVWDGTEPLTTRLHLYDDVGMIGIGGNAFELDDFDNEIWSSGSGAPLSAITTNDFAKFFLGRRGTGLGASPSIDRNFDRWDPDDGFYFRIHNHDGPRSSIGTSGNFPGFWNNHPTDASQNEPPGRNRQDVGRVNLFEGDSARVEMYLYPIGNVYNPGLIFWGGANEWYANDGPMFYVSSGTLANAESHSFQRDKVYKMITFFDLGAMRNHYYVHSNNFSSMHTRRYTFPAGNPGHIQLYSNACQAAWDDLRVIDDNGRFAKHFVVPGDIDFGTFHFNATLPAGTNAFFAGNTSGSDVSAGASLVDLSLSSQANNFYQSAGPYYPSIDQATLASGARIIEGPPSGGANVFSYSIRMTTTINGVTPVVPAIEDVSITYLPTTEIVYMYEN